MPHTSRLYQLFMREPGIFVSHRYWPEDGPVALSIMTTGPTREEADAKCRRLVEEIAEERKGLLAALARLGDAMDDLSESIYDERCDSSDGGARDRDGEHQLSLAFI